LPAAAVCPEYSSPGKSGHSRRRGVNFPCTFGPRPPVAFARGARSLEKRCPATELHELDHRARGGRS
jgi:hypothetical protein